MKIIILSQYQDYGKESIAYQLALGRVLAEDILADRDLPPFDRPTVDGIAIDFTAYEEGLRSFNIKAIQSAGEASVPINSETECIEINDRCSFRQYVKYCYPIRRHDN